MSDRDRSMEELEARIEAAEARAVNAERRARTAEESAQEALRATGRLPTSKAEARDPAPAPPPAPKPRRTPFPRFEESPSDFADVARMVEKRVQAMEARVADANLRVQALANPEPRAASATATAPAPTPEPATPAEAEAPESDDETKRGLLDINRISFEQLRDLGLSVTQSARLLATRDARGRFRSLDELDDLWGFSRELVERLMRRLSVGA